MHMRLTFLCLFLLAACDVAVQPRAYYEKLGGARTATIDGSQIFVVQAGYGAYAAWGGGPRSDRYSAYRESRAIELVSRCRIGKTYSKPSDEVTVASVDC